MYRQLGVVAALLAAAGCGKKGDECQQFWDKSSGVMAKMTPGKPMPADAKDKFLSECRTGDRMKNDPVFKCVLDASGEAAVSDCMTKAFGDYASKSKAIEAKLHLNMLSKNAKVYHAATGSFPVGKAGPTPAEPCCKGEGGKCAPSSEWDQEAWFKLNMRIDDPTYFQYSYDSDGKTVTATAVGDLDCDGTPITYTLEMGVDAEGLPTTNIVEPPAGSD